MIKIVGNPNFRPEHVNGTCWDFINTQLQAGAEETGPGAGWTKTAITIKVPFHNQTPKPGVYDYHVGDMYHRTLISVIREKLANAQHDELFHYQPYNLFWQHKESPTPINVYGELYTSEAFLEAHRNLQQSPPEPGCDRERVVVALMFWSDATQLTSFGNAKLWPCYMFFGNESKYRRCKPSCCLCNHVAYFNHVRTCDRRLLRTSVTSTISSFQMGSRTLQATISGARHHLLTLWHTVIASCTMHNGIFSLTMNSWKRGSTVLLFAVVMVSSAGFILDYSPTQLTTPKSECCPHTHVTFQVGRSNLVTTIFTGYYLLRYATWANIRVLDALFRCYVSII